MNEESRFVIGIDLGTTNCALAYWDSEKSGKIQLFSIPQFNRDKIVESFPLLPSFLYLAEPSECIENALALPWDNSSPDSVVGLYAKEMGASIPTKLVQSAKSWLCNEGAKRKEKNLPEEAFDEKRRISPVDATMRFLAHLKEAWNRAFAQKESALRLEEQRVILTVPASFDEVARELTFLAAKQAGLKNITLLEEPQAAFYHWMQQNIEKRESFFQQNDVILVCDVGGGTTDFSLIEVLFEKEKIGFQRMAVGPHLLLGGDNMDHALCRYVEGREQKEFSQSQYLSLAHALRKSKEVLLSNPEKSVEKIWVLGTGSSVIRSSICLEISEKEIRNLLLDGFFGLYDFDQAAHLKKSIGMRFMGLAYEQEPSITKHLAHFLLKSEIKSKPTHILFNGGALKPKIFQERIVSSLNHWYPNEKPITLLEAKNLDLAVAQGAAYFGKCSKEPSLRIRSSLARSFYLKVNSQEGQEKLLTILQRGSDAGTEYCPDYAFMLTANSAVSFQLYHSHTRLKDRIGDFVDQNEEEFTSLPPIQTILHYGKGSQTTLNVKLKVQLTEIGTFELFLFSETTGHIWKLEFQLQNEKRLADETLSASLLDEAQKVLTSGLTDGGNLLATLMPSLESVIEKPKNLWPISLIRTLFDVVAKKGELRKKSQQLESRIWNLLGFFLRPGFGYPLDDFRCRQVWNWYLADGGAARGEEIEIQKWICLRRIACGLKKGQQMQIFHSLFHSVYDPKKHSLLSEKKNGYAFVEKLRLLGSLELVDLPLKTKLGEALLERILSGNAEPALYWALMRIGARQLVIADASECIPKAVCEAWVLKLLNSAEQSEHFPFLLASLAKETDNRFINLSQEIHAAVLHYLKDKKEEIAWMQNAPKALDVQERFFGDALPPGLTLIRPSP